MFISQYFALSDPPSFALLKGPFEFDNQSPSSPDTLGQFGGKTFQLVVHFHLLQSLQNASELLREMCPFSMLSPILNSMQLDHLFPVSLAQPAACKNQEYFN